MFGQGQRTTDAVLQIVDDLGPASAVDTLRPQQLLLLTLVALVITAAVAFMLAVSGPLASAIGDALGVGPAALMVWNIARWPIVLVLVVLAVATLYYAAPNG